MGRHRAPRREWPLRPLLASAAVTAATLTVVAAVGIGPDPVIGQPWPVPDTPPARPGPVVPTPTAEAAAAAAAALSATGRARGEREAERSAEAERAEREKERQARAERERQREARESAEREKPTAKPAPPPPPEPAPPPPSSEPPAAKALGAPCPTGLAGTVAHVSRAGHHIAGQLGVPLGSILGRGDRGSSTSDHPTGHALDYMVDVATGNRLAAYVLAHRAELGVKYVIWRQRYNDGSGWSDMEDRGSPTANHMDHVHVSFNDSAGAGLPC